MPEVPYTGLPSVAPREAPPDDYQHVDVKPEQFGGAIAKGVEQAGKGVEELGNDFFKTAQFQESINADDQTNKWIPIKDKILYGDPSKHTIGPDGQPVPDTGFFGTVGGDASEKREETIKAIQDAAKQGGDNLSPQAKLIYDRNIRRMTADAESRINTHTEQQWKVYAHQTQVSGADLSLNGYVRSVAMGDTEAAKNHAADYKSQLLQAGQLKFGFNEKIEKDIAQKAEFDLLKAQVEYVGTQNAAKALEILDEPENRSIAGTKYDDLYRPLRARADKQIGDQAGKDSMITVQGRPPDKPAAGVPVNFIGGIKASEGFQPRAQWDFKQFTNGYGTRARSPNEVIDQATAEQRFSEEIGKAAEIVDRVNPNLDPGTRAALTSLTFNAGDKWINSGLGEKVRAGDIAGAQQAFLQYNRAGGAVNPGLAARREREAAWFGHQDIAPSPRAVQAGSYAAIEANPYLSDDQKRHAFQYIREATVRQEIEDGQNERQRKQVSDDAAGKYVTAIADGLHTPGTDFVQMAGRVAHDDDLDWRTKEHLLDRIKHVSGEEEMAAYGPGYPKALEGLLSSSDAPGHVRSVGDLIEDKSITTAGLRNLETRMQLARKSVDRQSNEKIMSSYLKYAYKRLSFEEDNGFMKIRDPKGESLYTGTFVPMFEHQASQLMAEAERTGDERKLREFLSRQNVDKMTQELRPERQMAGEKMQALGGAAGGEEKPGTPLPPAPEGIEPKGWTSLMAKPPGTASGPMNHAVWGAVLETLASDPNSEMQAKFDRWAGGSGYTAKDVLGRLGIKSGEKIDEIWRRP